MSLKLNNQMQNFYTSEIIILPRKVNTLNLQENPELQIVAIKEVVEEYLSSKEAFANTKNISFFNQEYANFPIEEIRRMQAEAEYSTSFGGQENRVFVLFNFDSASDAAQNAALKIIEESPKNTLILLLVTKKDKIFETIISRCLIVQLETEDKKRVENELPIDFAWPKNYSQAIELATLNKDRLKALHLVEQLLELKDLNLKQKQVLLRSYQDLNRNQNVQIVLENCFFSLVGLES